MNNRKEIFWKFHGFLKKTENVDIPISIRKKYFPETITLEFIENLSFIQRLQHFPDHLNETEIADDNVFITTWSSMFDDRNTIVLPKNLIVHGSLFITGSERIKKEVILPKKLIVDSTIQTQEIDIYDAPDICECNRLSISYANVSLHNPAIINGAKSNSSFFTCEIEHLPDNIHAQDTLSFNSCNIKKLPQNLVCEKSLFIEKTNISDLPKDIKVKKTLFAQGSLLNTNYTAKEIKEKFDIEGNVYL